MKKEGQKGISLNKYLAERGYASRREADKLIEDGLVSINGKVTKKGNRVFDGDEVIVKEHKAKEFKYYAYYKPRGIVTIGAQEGEKEISDVAKLPTKVFPIGRLDKDSEGLIIMTNDGRITKQLLSPEAKHEKEYLVEVNEPITHAFLVQMRNGVRIGKVGKIKNYKTKPCKIRKVDRKKFEIILTEGKNRQIRKMCGALGMKVTSLKRFRIEDIDLGNLRPNTFREVRFR